MGSLKAVFYPLGRLVRVAKVLRRIVIREMHAQEERSGPFHLNNLAKMSARLRLSLCGKVIWIGYDLVLGPTQNSEAEKPLAENQAIHSGRGSYIAFRSRLRESERT